MTEPVSVDRTDGDWIKRGSWDLMWRGRRIDNVADLREFIQAIGMTVAEFKQLAVYVGNVRRPELPWLGDL